MSRRRFLVCYDICDPGRLRAVHSVMKAFGHAVQYSVFVCDLDQSERFALRYEIGQVINHTSDRILFADLGEATGPSRFTFMGRTSILPRQGPTIV